MADLSRSMAGVLGSTLVIAVPGSVSGATESLHAIEPLLEHALRRSGGHTQHTKTRTRADGRARPALPARAAALRCSRSSASRCSWRVTCACGRTRDPRQPSATSPAASPRVFKYAIVQVRMFRDLDAGIMHATIFWGFVILTVGTADRVTFGLVHTIGRSLLDGWLWRLLLLGQNLFVLGVLVMVGYALFRRLVWRYPRRTTLSRDALIILLLIGGVVLSEWLAEGFRHRRFRRSGRGLGGHGATRCRRAQGSPLGKRPAGGLRAFLLGQRRAGQLLPGLPAALKHLHIVTAFFNAALRKMRPRGELPAMDLEAAGRPIRRQDHRGPVVEGPA